MIHPRPETLYSGEPFIRIRFSSAMCVLAPKLRGKLNLSIWLVGCYWMSKWTELNGISVYNTLPVWNEVRINISLFNTLFVLTCNEWQVPNGREQAPRYNPTSQVISQYHSSTHGTSWETEHADFNYPERQNFIVARIIARSKANLS